MKNHYLFVCLFLGALYTYSQCSFPVGATQNGATQSFCVSAPPQSQNVSNARGNNYILLNVVQGFTYEFSVGDEFPSSSENLDIFNLSNVNIGFSSGTNGATITNWVAPYSGQVKIVLSFDACNFSSVSGRTITLTLLGVGNTLDNQNARGVNTWIGHAYDWIYVPPSPGEFELPPGGTVSPVTPTSTFPFNNKNYIGYYNVGSETITENFGGNTVCFPLISGGSTLSSVFTTSFAMRYKMRSTRPAGCYMATIKCNDGVRLYVDNQLVFSEWKIQNTLYSNILIYLDGDAELVLDYYDNVTTNIIEFSLSSFDNTTNSISFVGDSQVCNNVAPGFLNGTSYTYRATATNPTIHYQWQVSNDNITFVDIPGATSQNYTPPGTTTAGFRYFRRLVSPSSNIGSCFNPSNVISLETIATPPLSTPVIITPTNLQCDSFDANWNTVSGAISYLLYVSTTSNFTAILPGYDGLDVGNVTSYTISGLDYSTTYYYRIQAVSSACSSRFSSTVNFSYLYRPSRPTISFISCDSFSVNWASIPRADSYELDVSSVSNFATYLPGFNGLNVGGATSHLLTGLPLDTPIYFRVRAVSNICGTSLSSASNSNMTIWNGTTWSAGIPDFTKFVLINGDYDMTTLPSIDACTLQVNNGRTLTITAGKNVNVQNKVIVQPLGLLQVLNNGSLVQITDGVTNTGNISLERLNQIRLQDYVYWSSPVLNFPLLNLSPSTPSNFVLNWDAVSLNSNGGQGDWKIANENMIVGKGYAIRGPNGFTNGAPQNFTATFTGVPNNGVISFPIERGSNLGAGSNGPNGVLRTVFDDNWNLVGNPYPSSIDAMAFLTNNPDIDGNIRIWSSTTLPSDLVSDPFYNNFLYNYSPNDYIVHNGTATTSGPESFNGYIASGQSFMVMMNEGATAATSSVVFNNAMRSNLYDNSEFYRNAQPVNEKHRIWLDLISNRPNGSVSRTVVGYVDGATNDKDRLYDAVTTNKLSQNFYSVLDDEILCIQGKGLPFLESDVISLGYKGSQNGSYTIAIAAVDGVFEGSQTVYLEDRLTNIIHNLSESPYVFQSNSGIYNNRFALRYANSTLSNPDFDANSIVIYTEDDKIYMNSGIESISSYEVYDILGRLLISDSKVSSNQVIVELQKSNQPLVVKAKFENNQVVTKKIIH
ncbi:T9SS sorting signal type C domain-containing protein [Flavobacterium sp.]|uniref:T9SS sorting signal type C domain-containing protein n=4 Tax=Flavobacterium sp. TaxID=239 RepID=UPI0040477CCF